MEELLFNIVVLATMMVFVILAGIEISLYVRDYIFNKKIDKIISKIEVEEEP